MPFGCKKGLAACKQQWQAPFVLAAESRLPRTCYSMLFAWAMMFSTVMPFLARRRS